MDADGAGDREFGECLGDDEGAFFFSERAVGFVVEGAHGPAFVVVAHPTLEGYAGAGMGVGEGGLESDGVERLVGEAEAHDDINLRRRAG